MLGERIRKIREAKGISLTELSKRSGVQLATLSRMENAKMTGTLESHIAIAKALNVELLELYKGIDKASPPLTPAGPKETSGIFTHNEKASYEILTSNVMSKKMMPILLRVEPGGSTSKEQNANGTEKFIFVLEGILNVYVGEETYTLSKSNTLYFDAGMEHYFSNPTNKLARALCVMTPMQL